MFSIIWNKDNYSLSVQNSVSAFKKEKYDKMQAPMSHQILTFVCLHRRLRDVTKPDWRHCSGQQRQRIQLSGVKSLLLVFFKTSLKISTWLKYQVISHNRNKIRFIDNCDLWCNLYFQILWIWWTLDCC